MRASIVASLCVVGLIGLGLRSRQHCGIAPAYAQEPTVTVKAGKTTVEIGRTPASVSLWKQEVVGPDVPVKEESPKDSLASARQQALKAAAEKLSAYLQARFPGYRYRPTPDFLVSHKLVDAGENVEYVLDNPEAPKMVRHKLTVELRDLQLARLLDEDRREHSAERLEVAGRGLAGLVLILVALVGYVRLDDWTRGYFSTFLKFTALALAVGGAALLWYLI